MFILFKGDVELEDVVNYETFDNGNYMITYIADDGAGTSLNFVEVTHDGYLVDVTTEYMINDGDTDYISTISYSFNYGTLVESEVLALVQLNSNN